MKVTLAHFRSHVSTTVTLDQGLNLICGPSGIGKTTVFNSIFWLLYGSKKVKSVNPLGKPEQPTMVKLEYGNLVIQRSRNPGLFTITIMGDKMTTLTDDPAEAWIETNLGPKDVFLCSAYLMQKEKSYLLDLSHSAQFQLLNWLSFQGDSPQLYITKITKAAKEYQDRYQQVKIKYETRYQMWMEEYRLNPIKYPEVTADKITSLTHEVNDLIKQYEQAINTWNLYQQQEHSQKLLLQDQRRVEMLLKELGEVIETDSLTESISLLEVKRRELEAKINNGRRQLSLRTQIKKISFHPDTSKYTLDEITNYRRIRSIYQHYKIEYSEQRYRLLIDLINKYKLYLKYQEQLRWKKQKEEIEIKRKKLEDEMVKREPPQYDGIELDLINKYRQLIAKVKGMWTKDYLELVKRWLPHWSNRDRLLAQRKRYQELVDKYHTPDHLTKYNRMLSCPECKTDLAFCDDELVKFELTGDQYSKLYQEFKQLETVMKPLWNWNWELLNQLKPEDIAEIPTQQSLLQIYSTKWSDYIWTELDLDKWIEDKRNWTIYQDQIAKLNQINQEYDNLVLFLKRMNYSFDLEPIEEDPEFKNIELYQRFINDLGKHTWSPVIEVTPEDWSSYQYHNSLKDGITDEIIDIEADQKELSTMLDESAKLKHKANQQSIQREKRRRWAMELNDINSKLSQMKPIPNTKELAITLHSEIDTKRKMLVDFQSSWKLVTQYQIITTDNKEMTDLYQMYHSCLQLINLCKQVEQERLTQIVTDFNHLVNNVLVELFDQDIFFVATTSKTIKSTGMEKACFDIKLVLRGIESDFSALSGGEKDRVSLAILIGLTHFTTIPFILIDECLSSLDSEVKEKAIDVIRNHCPDKIVVMIDHGVNPGWFDRVVKL